MRNLTDPRLLALGIAMGPEPMDIDIDNGSSMPNQKNSVAPQEALKNGRIAKSRSSIPRLKTRLTKSGKPICTSRLLIIAAHLRNVCITRQINLIYGNPCIDIDCGHCSSCSPDSPPDPCPLISSSLADLSDMLAPESIINESDKTPKWQRLTWKDYPLVIDPLWQAAWHIWLSSPMLPEASFLSVTCFLSKANIKNIVQDFHPLLSKDVLAARLHGWCYWDTYGQALWEAIYKIKLNIQGHLEEIHEIAKNRWQEASQRLAAEKVHNSLVVARLDQIKRVRLVIHKPNTAEIGEYLFLTIYCVS